MISPLKKLQSAIASDVKKLDFSKSGDRNNPLKSGYAISISGAEQTFYEGLSSSQSPITWLFCGGNNRHKIDIT
jgi:hypothetical protein